ncbi:MAG: pseudouridine synthase [Rhodospirillales bacterium]|nr:pseudouridine synthase [Rhodospirillales bacterium]
MPKVTEDTFDDLERDEEIQAEPGLGRRIEIVLSETAEGQRLDRALTAALPDLSRVRVQAMLAEGRVTRDGALIADASARARPGQRIVIDIPPPVTANPQPQNIPLKIVFEDEEMLVIDKPAGMVVHPGAGNPDHTLVNALLFHCGDQLSGIGGVRRPGIVHRLDKDTSGLMVVAKTDRAHSSLSDQLQTRSLKRIYNAVVWGRPMSATGRIEGNIGRSPNDRKRMALVVHGGRPAVTHYRILQPFKAASLIECRLETGRTHQIRVHMAHLGHPLVGDPVYGLKRPPKDAPAIAKSLPRQALHATQVTFLHPLTKIEMCYSSTVSDDLAALIAVMS